jgi:PAS domain S-box-containing protein
MEQRTPPERGNETCGESGFRELVEKLPLVTFVESPGPEGRTLYVSPQIEQMLGYPAQAWLDDRELFLRVLHPDDVERMRAEPEEPEPTAVFRVVARDGKVFTVQSGRVLVRDDAGAPLHTLGFWVDIGERLRLEEELRQAQKLEAIGKLAAGIAHDFNNLLLVQRGYGELAVRHLELGEHDTAREHIGEMLDAGERAADLTHQLLAFARRQVLDLEVLDLSLVASELERLLRRLLRDNVTLVAETAPAPVFVRADRGQLEQVIANLAINARDAMPEGGRLRIAVSTADGGRTATLTVSDTGVGMNPETAERIFEPFFTTKAPEGTGLGLATVQGIVSQCGGEIAVRSTPGSGTTFTIALPTTAPPEAVAGPDETPGPRSGGETILVVEDEESVRVTVTRMLEARGYRVLPAGNSEGALEIARAHDGELDLLLTDVVLPGASGRATAESIRESRPAIKVLYMSGYGEDRAIPPGAGDDPLESFIQKPFTGEELAREVRGLLDSGSP